jgi:SAM-dependent methyltransferase
MGNVSESDLIGDIGCGFLPDIKQSSVFNSIGLDINFEHGKVMVKYPIISDAQYIPIKDNCIDFYNCQGLLEHLSDPRKCLRDMKRSLKPNGKGFILIPIDSRQIYQTLFRFIKEFPYSFLRTVTQLKNAMTIWKMKGMLHIRQISIDNIKEYFKIERLARKRHTHFWFDYKRTPIRILKRLKLLRRNIKVKEYSEWYVWIRKE